MANPHTPGSKDEQKGSGENGRDINRREFGEMVATLGGLGAAFGALVGLILAPKSQAQLEEEKGWEKLKAMAREYDRGIGAIKEKIKKAKESFCLVSEGIVSKKGEIDFDRLINHIVDRFQYDRKDLVSVNNGITYRGQLMVAAHHYDETNADEVRILHPDSRGIEIVTVWQDGKSVQTQFEELNEERQRKSFFSTIRYIDDVESTQLQRFEKGKRTGYITLRSTRNGFNQLVFDGSESSDGKTKHYQLMGRVAPYVHTENEPDKKLLKKK